MDNDGRLYKVFKHLVVALMMILYIFPILYLINISFKTQNEFLQNPVSIATAFRYQNYSEAWTKAKFGTYIGNSFIYASICPAISLVMAIFTAFPIARGYLKHSKFWNALFLSSMFLPGGGVIVFQMILKIGLYNTRIGYMLTKIGGTGLAFLVFVAYIQSIPKDLDEAAAIDGCGYFKYVWRIIVPLMKPSIAGMAIMAALGVWNDIIGATIYLSSEKYYPITKGLFAFTGQYTNDWPQMAAAVMIVAAPLMIFYLFMQKYIIEGAVAGAVKQ